MELATDANRESLGTRTLSRREIMKKTFTMQEKLECEKFFVTNGAESGAKG
jgi:hypothetical protein